MKNKLVILGISGRMGKEILSLALQDEVWEVKGGIDKNAGDFSVPIFSSESTEVFLTTDVLIDFTLPEVTTSNLKLAVKYSLPIVIGTTGLSEDSKKYLEDAARVIPIFYSSNFSVGMALMKKLSEKCSESLPESSIDIIETHHVHKKDAPSGSAISLKESVKDATVHSIRAGEVIGEHVVYFHTKEEKITLSHNVFSRTAFARGALRAAQFVIGKPPGLYSMEDLLA